MATEIRQVRYEGHGGNGEGAAAGGLAVELGNSQDLRVRNASVQVNPCRRFFSRGGGADVSGDSLRGGTRQFPVSEG